MFKRSTFHNVGGQVAKEDHYFGLQPSITFLDSADGLAVGPNFTAIPWRGPGGRVLVVRNQVGGRVESDAPVAYLDADPLCDLAFCPHDDKVLATGSESGVIKISQVEPEGDRFGKVETTLAEFSAHNRRVCPVVWHPLVKSLLLSSGADNLIKLWDTQSSSAVATLGGMDQLVTSLSLSRAGDLVGCANKDGKVRVFDPRKGDREVLNAAAHQGNKCVRVFWADEHHIATAGNTMSMTREIKLWDTRNMGDSVSRVDLGAGSGVMMPIFDYDSKLLVVPSRGDGLFRTCEVRDGSLEECAVFQSGLTSVVAVAAYPKQCCSVMDKEVIKLSVLVDDTLRTVSMTVPRRSEHFQDDIFVPCWDRKPTMSVEEWMSGANTPPNTVSLQPEGSIAESSIEKPQVEKRLVTPEERDALFVDSEKEAMDRLGNLMANFEPQEKKEEPEGVDEDEWSDP